MTRAHGLQLAEGVRHDLLLRGGGIWVMIDDALPAEENRVVVVYAWSIGDIVVVGIVVYLRPRVFGLRVPWHLLWQIHPSLALGVRWPPYRGLLREGLVRHRLATRDIGRAGDSEARSVCCRHAATTQDDGTHDRKRQGN